MYASYKGYNKIVNYLSIRIKHQLDQEDSNKMTILMHYLLKGDIDMAKKIASRGADINYVNSNGLTALHLCVEN